MLYGLHFSLYLTNKSTHIDDIESVIISISNPKENKVKPKGNTDTKLKKELETMYKKNTTRRIRQFII